uniref:Uncharacterized protein n=1 Tax=Oryza nivara TaxID=4536 RepID=A0A0E0HF56_ORYNI
MEAADGQCKQGSGDGLRAVGDDGWHAAAARQLAAPRQIPLRVAYPLWRGGEDGDGGWRAVAEVFWSRRRRPFGLRWPKRRQRILGKETAGLGGGGIVHSGVWQKCLGVRAEDFSGGDGGPRGSDRTETESRWKRFSSTTAAEVFNNGPWGGDELGVQEGEEDP